MFLSPRTVLFRPPRRSPARSIEKRKFDCCSQWRSVKCRRRRQQYENSERREQGVESWCRERFPLRWRLWSHLGLNERWTCCGIRLDAHNNQERPFLVTLHNFGLSFFGTWIKPSSGKPTVWLEEEPPHNHPRHDSWAFEARVGIWYGHSLFVRCRGWFCSW